MQGPHGGGGRACGGAAQAEVRSQEELSRALGGHVVLRCLDPEFRPQNSEKIMVWSLEPLGLG